QQRLRPPIGGVDAMKRKPQMTAISPTVRLPMERKEFKRDAKRDRPHVPHTVFLKECRMPDGRMIVIDKRFIGFVCQGKPEEFGGKEVAVIAFKGWAKAVPVVDDYDDLVAWWKTDVTSNGRAAP